MGDQRACFRNEFILLQFLYSASVKHILLLNRNYALRWEKRIR